MWHCIPHYVVLIDTLHVGGVTPQSAYTILYMSRAGRRVVARGCILQLARTSGVALGTAVRCSRARRVRAQTRVQRAAESPGARGRARFHRLFLSAQPSRAMRRVGGFNSVAAAAGAFLPLAAARRLCTL